MADTTGNVTITCNDVGAKALERLNELLDIKDAQLDLKDRDLQAKIAEAEGKIIGSDSTFHKIRALEHIRFTEHRVSVWRDSLGTLFLSPNM